MVILLLWKDVFQDEVVKSHTLLKLWVLCFNYISDLNVLREDIFPFLIVLERVVIMRQETHHFPEIVQSQRLYCLLVFLNQLLFNASKCLLHYRISCLMVYFFVTKLTSKFTQKVPTYASQS